MTIYDYYFVLLMLVCWVVHGWYWMMRTLQACIREVNRDR
jgi:hypothetical protein